jgi:chemotaxis protein MotB
MDESEGQRKLKKDEPRRTSAWMVTFSDLSTLLLTFFVLLLSMSSMDDRTLKSMFTNFTSACGILYFKEYGEIYRPKEVLIEGLYESLQEILTVKRSEDQVVEAASKSKTSVFDKVGGLEIDEFHKGFKLVFGHQLLFAQGSAKIKEEMKPLLQKISKFISTSAYQVYIDGHTDNVPINTVAYPSNEDLSLARAYNLLDYLVRNGKVSPGAIAMAGYGEFRPMAPNDTPQDRAKNRRVEIIFKGQKYF